jgi:hypothetical protein
MAAATMAGITAAAIMAVGTVGTMAAGMEVAGTAVVGTVAAGMGVDTVTAAAADAIGFRDPMGGNGAAGKRWNTPYPTL